MNPDYRITVAELQQALSQCEGNDQIHVAGCPDAHVTGVVRDGDMTKLVIDGVWERDAGKLAEEKNERLFDLVRKLVRETPDTCPYCGLDDGEHADGCALSELESESYN